jgi:hypothetical protein
MVGYFARRVKRAQARLQKINARSSRPRAEGPNVFLDSCGRNARGVLVRDADNLCAIDTSI